jgi:hypothetical protein
MQIIWRKRDKYQFRKHKEGIDQDDWLNVNDRGKLEKFVKRDKEGKERKQS